MQPWLQCRARAPSDPCRQHRPRPYPHRASTAPPGSHQTAYQTSNGSPRPNKTPTRLPLRFQGPLDPYQASTAPLGPYPTLTGPLPDLHAPPGPHQTHTKLLPGVHCSSRTLPDHYQASTLRQGPPDLFPTNPHQPPNHPPTPHQSPTRLPLLLHASTRFSPDPFTNPILALHCLSRTLPDPHQTLTRSFY